jgi:2-iminobutanoate/2-iminopropanoate deaminase
MKPLFHSFDSGVPPIRGHYSHAVSLPGGLVVIAGQKAWDPVTGELTGEDIIQQTHLVFDNVEAILSACGLSLADLVRVQCHLADVEDYEAFNAVYAQRLGDARPVRTVLGGYQLREGALVELVVDAFASV